MAYVVQSRSMCDDSSAREISGADDYLGFSFQISYSPVLITSKFICINETEYSYTGGNHGNGHIRGLNYQLNPLLEIGMYSFFDTEENDTVLQFISDYCFRELQKIWNDNSNPPATPAEIEAQTKESIFIEHSLDPQWKNFNTFFITKTGFEIVFNAYTVAGYAFSTQSVLIPYEKILAIVKNKQLLQDLIASVS